jgi:hypothetical protein
MVRLWRLVATEADRDQLAEYCRLEAMRLEAEGEVARNGVMMVTPNGCAVQPPWMQIFEPRPGGHAQDRRRVRRNAGKPDARHLRPRRAERQV